MNQSNNQDDMFIDVNISGDLSDILKKELRAQVAMYSGAVFKSQGVIHHLHNAIEDVQLSEETKADVIEKYKRSEANRLLGGFKRRANVCLRRLRTQQRIESHHVADALLVLGDEELQCLKYAKLDSIENAMHYWQAKRALRNHEDDAIQMDFDFAREMLARGEFFGDVI